MTVRVRACGVLVAAARRGYRVRLDSDRRAAPAGARVGCARVEGRLIAVPLWDDQWEFL